MNHVIEPFIFWTTGVATGVNMVCIENSMCFNSHTRQFVIQERNILFASRNDNCTEYNRICWHQFHFLYMTAAKACQHCELFALGSSQIYCLLFGGQIFDFVEQIYIVAIQVSHFDSHFTKLWQTDIRHWVWITAFFNRGNTPRIMRRNRKHFHTCNTARITSHNYAPWGIFHNFS